MEYLIEGKDVLDKKELQQVKAGNCGTYICNLVFDILDLDLCIVISCLPW